MDLKDDGSFKLDMRYFNFCQGLTMTNRRFAELFGGPPRSPESPLTQREMDLAASVQQVTELAVERIVREAHRQTGESRLCLAGGVAPQLRGQRQGAARGTLPGNLDPAGGGRRRRRPGGGPLRLAPYLGNPRPPCAGLDRQAGSYLGPAYAAGRSRPS